MKATTKHLASHRLIQWGIRATESLRGVHGSRALLALVDQFIVGGANFLTLVLLGRFAGPHELGMFALVMTVYYLLLAVQESLITVPYTIFGVRLRASRQREYAGAVLSQSVTWSGVLAVILGIAAAIGLISGLDPHTVACIAAFALVSPLWLLREFGRRYLFAHMRVTKVLVMTIVSSVGQFIVVAACAYSGSLSAAAALFAVGVGNGIAGLGWLWFSRAEFRLNHRNWSYYARKNWIMGRWLLACQGTNIVSTTAMPWLVWIWLGPTATGLFAACDAILRFANPIIVSLNNVLTPRVALGLNDGGKAELNRIVCKASAMLMLFLVAFCIGLIVAGEWFLDRSFGKAYAGAWATLVVLGLNQVVAKLSLAPGRALLIVHRANINLLAEVAGFATTLLAAPLLISAYGTVGAAAALLTGSVVNTAVTLWYYRSVMRERPSISHFAAEPTSMAPAGALIK